MVHGIMFSRHVPVDTHEPKVVAHVKSSPYFRVMRDTIDEDYSTPGPHSVEQPQAPYPADLTTPRHHSMADHKYATGSEARGPWPGDLTAPRHPMSADHPMPHHGYHPSAYRPEHDGGVIPHAPAEHSTHYGRDVGDGEQGDHLGHPMGYHDGYHDGHRDAHMGRPHAFGYSYHMPAEHHIDDGDGPPTGR
jgi:hypothetical protein